MSKFILIKTFALMFAILPVFIDITNCNRIISFKNTFVIDFRHKIKPTYYNCDKLALTNIPSQNLTNTNTERLWNVL